MSTNTWLRSIGIVATLAVIWLLHPVLSPHYASAERVAEAARSAAVVGLDYSDALTLNLEAAPGSLAIADLNQDTNLDVIAVSPSGNSISVLEGRGNGTFSAQPPFASSGQMPLSVAVGRFNNDPYPDLVTANLSTSDLSLFLNDGHGKFAAPVSVKTDAGPVCVVAADLNGDGLDDLATANIGENAVDVFFNQGNGKMRKIQAFASGGASPRALLAADFNGDGRNDLAVVNGGSNDLTILLNIGSGRFSPGHTVVTDAGPQALCAGDFNGDGLLDIATANDESDTVSILLNQGAGIFVRTASYSVKHPSGISVADVNGDNKADLIVPELNNGAVAILLGEGAGRFSEAVRMPISGEHIGAVATADFNKDGKVDIVTANTGSHNLAVLLHSVHAPRIEKLLPELTATVQLTGVNATINQEISAKFNTPLDEKTLNKDSLLIYGSMTGFHPYTSTYDDKTYTVTLKPDGKLKFQPGEILNVEFTNQIRSVVGLPIAAAYTHSFTIQPRKGAGHFVQSQLIDCDKIPGRLRVADFDNDGYPDIVALCREVDGIRVHFNNGKGEFTHEAHHFLKTAGSGPWDLWAADLNRDGLIDIVVVNTFSSDMAIFYNAGNRHFKEPQVIPCGAGPMGVRAGDVNGDGYPDIIAVTKGFPAVLVFLNDTKGGFKTPSTYLVAPSPYDISIRDLNGDGALDLVMTNLESDRGTILLNRGDGTFHKPDEFPLLLAKALVEEPIDVNRDGHTDIVAVNTASDDISIFLNDGKNDFQQQRRISVGATPTDKVFGDFNNDGYVDMAITLDGGSVVLLLNNGDGTFRRAETINVGKNPTSPVAADFNGDGTLDLIIANQYSHNLSVLLNLPKDAPVDHNVRKEEPHHKQ